MAIKNMTKRKYFIVLEERNELTAVIEAFTEKEAYEMARHGDYDIDESTALTLPTLVKRVQWID